MRDLAVLDRLPLAQISPEEFAAYAIVIGVESNPDPSSPRRLAVPADEGEHLEALRTELQRISHHFKRGLTDAGRAEQEGRILLGLMSIELQEDAMCNRLPGGRPLILAKTEAARRHGRRAIAEMAHRGEVEQAEMRGEVVPEPVRHYYFGPLPAAKAGEAALA